jgi:hypothetical protein
MKKKGTHDFSTRGFEVIHKVRKRQHQKPFFGHIGGKDNIKNPFLVT